MIHTHPHPGEILREEVFEPLELTVTAAAQKLAMSRVALSRVLNGKARISPDLALRLERAGASTTRTWSGSTNLQEKSVGGTAGVWLASCSKNRQPKCACLEGLLRSLQ